MRLLPVLLLALLAAPPARASAIYTYREKDGTIVYTNVPPAGVKARRLGSASFRQAPRPAEVPVRSVISPSLYLDWMTEAAHKYNIPLALVRAVAHAESNYDARAQSRKGASGLMQLMPTTASDMYVRDVFDARQNIFGGVRYLRVLANEFDGQMETIVAAYNAGPDAVRKYGNQVPPFEETRAYVQKVLALYFQYKQEGEMTSQVEPSSWR
ncbi:MAG TPA: lytic transglycosylase domain-containing protein [Myxococcaceae bacterium]|nr:lytic transglycosylase domain-containing protein [Myxococcaceae bacterium]